MKKITLVALMAVLGTTSANAGFWDSLGFGKKAEPATLEEACDTDEITKVCPEIVLGTKTVTECLAENVKSLSKQCSKFVKKSVADKADAVKQGVADAKATSAEQKAAQKQAIADKKAEIKEKVAEAKANAKAAAAEKKAAAKEQKAAIKAAGKEIADAAKETGAAAKETGVALKNIM